MEWTGPPMPRRAPWLAPGRPVSPCCGYVLFPKNDKWWCPFCWCQVVRPAEAREVVETHFAPPPPPAPFHVGPVRTGKVSEGQGTLL